MSGNSFGDVFKVSTFGESHGAAIGCVIDGCPSGLEFDEAFIQSFLDLRRPGRNGHVSPRDEKDQFQVLSGIYQGKTTGAPIAIMIPNRNFDSSPYKPIENLLRPGHANFTYLEKFGIFDPRGGGRASARETAARTAAGAIALLILKHYGIQIDTYVTKIGNLEAKNWDCLDSDIFCPDSQLEPLMKRYLDELQKEGDSIGGIVTGIIKNAPIGLGEPVFDRFEAKLAHALLSIPATKGFEIGEGFQSCIFKGSEFNDPFLLKEGKIALGSNHSGGTLGGITTGEPIVFKTVFKPTSSIKKTQATLSLSGQPSSITLSANAKHDPCVAIRGCIVVKAMAACVTCDLLLKSRTSQLQYASYSQSRS